MAITLRNTKGSALTYTELDGNFTFISGSYALTGSNSFVGNQTITGSLTVSGSTTVTGNTTITGSLTVSGSTTVISSLIKINGTTSSFPALKRSTTTLQVRLADDSAFTNIQGKITTDVNAVVAPIVADSYLILYDASGTAYKVPVLLF